ncbi:MAG: hypothetical protein Q9208_001035 [Pyrenodesmia sp. 3 TL-2023]
MPPKPKGKRGVAATSGTAREHKRQEPDIPTSEEEKEWVSTPRSKLFRRHSDIEKERQSKRELERAKILSDFDTPPPSNDFSSVISPDHPIKMKAPPDNIADDPYGVNDPWSIKETMPVMDRGEIWHLADDPIRREAGRKEWEQAHQFDPNAKAEDLYPEAPDILTMPRPEYHKRKGEEYFKHRNARRFEIIKDKDYDYAIKAGPEVIEQMRDLERRYILDKEGVPPKRPVTAEDLDTLYANYVRLLSAPAHKFPGCLLCEKAARAGKFYYYTIKLKTRAGGESDEAWHFHDNTEAKPAERACKKFLKALVGFELQKKKASIQAPIIAENVEREKAGKKPIPLNETRIEKMVREINEGHAAARVPEPDAKPETSEEREERRAKELKASEEVMIQFRAKEEAQRLKAGWERYKTAERFLKIQGQSVSDALERPDTLFMTYYPCGLPYDGHLVYSKADVMAEDWERFKKDRVGFEEEEGKKLPEGVEKEQWERYINGLLEEHKPPRSLLTEHTGATQ